MDVFVQQLKQQKELLKHAYQQTGTLPPMAEQSMISKQLGEQFDARLRKAEHLNLKLSEEHTNLKSKLADLESKLQLAKGPTGFDDLLSKVFEDGDKTLVHSGSQRNIQNRNFGMGNETLMDLNFGEDQESDLQFRLGVLESDTQQAQTENNRLVETMLDLKKTLREKQSFKADKVSTELLLQEVTELKRHIHVQDEEIDKLEQDISATQSKLQNGPSPNSRPGSMTDLQTYNTPFEELKKLELTVEKKRIEIMSTKQRIDSKESQLQSVRVQRNNERAKALLQLDRDNSEAAELKHKISELKRQIANLEQAAAQRQPTVHQSQMLGGINSSASLEQQLADLTRKNDTMLVELQRLSQLNKEQKQKIQAAEGQPNRPNVSLDMSGIDYRQQSMNMSYLNPFR